MTDLIIILVTAALTAWAMLSSKQSQRRTEAFYAGFFTPEELDRLDRNPDGSLR
jgi:hypothetical protein